jgi:hypothetical protein
MGAEQLVCFHGKGSKAVARRFKQSGHAAFRASQIGPDGLFLGGREQQAFIERALSPGGADKVLPVLDGGRWPGREAFGAAGTMEAGREGSRGALAGRNDQAAAAQPDIDFRICNCPHSSVIR